MEVSFQWTSKTKVEFLKKLPGEARLSEALGVKPEKFLLIYDKRLKHHPAVGKWLEDFPLTYPVRAGERLKDLHDFSDHVKKIFKLISPFSAHTLAIVSIGGGSVGDFAGFLASVLKRGVPLIHIPTTLLAAMDSAHGGKTALNVAGIKNQIGTFHPAEAVLIVKSLFEGLPALQLQSAGGELAKMAFLVGGSLFQKFQTGFKPELEFIWECLPEIIEAKYKIVEQDPFERTGIRQILNLGHSLGHVLESYHDLAHGVAVGEGLIFALNWSAHRGYFRGEVEELTGLLESQLGLLAPKTFVKKYRLMSRSKLTKLLVEDKKLADARRMNFIFLEKVGTAFRKTVQLEALLTETQRQGWTSL